MTGHLYSFVTIIRQTRRFLQASYTKKSPSVKAPWARIDTIPFFWYGELLYTPARDSETGDKRKWMMRSSRHRSRSSSTRRWCSPKPTVPSHLAYSQRWSSSTASYGSGCARSTSGSRKASAGSPTKTARPASWPPFPSTGSSSGPRPQTAPPTSPSRTSGRSRHTRLNPNDHSALGARYLSGRSCLCVF